MTKFEVLPVPAEMVPHVWKRARRVVFSKVPGYNQERLYVRLRSGVDQLWICMVPGKGHEQRYFGRVFLGAVVTSITPKPPQARKDYLRPDPAQMKSITVHYAGEHFPLSWFDSAHERISRYARENDCRMIFLLARKGWQRYLMRQWYSKEWEMVAFGRDRPTISKCKVLHNRNTPGWFRKLIPLPAEKWNRYYHAYRGVCYFKEAS